MNSGIYKLFSCAVSLSALFMGTGIEAQDYPFRDTSLSVEARLDDLIHRMTLEEKTLMLSGYRNFNIHPCERLGIPAFRMADGPLGIASWGDYGRATAFPATLLLSATWDRNLAYMAGSVYSEEWRSRGLHFMLAPGVNMYRASKSARNFEYFGEDPYLTSSMAVPFIRGVQDGGVAATIKHFVANDQEFDRYRVSTEVGERALREIYLKPFEAAVREAGVKAVMTGYNPVNGVYCTENSFIIGILKDEWGFSGPLMSDWDCTYSENAAINGLDLEMGSNKWLVPEILIPMVEDGRISEAAIDDKVRRIYRACMEMGFFDRDQKADSIRLFNRKANEMSRKIAEEGIILLKNDGILPLDRSSVRKIAVIGPDANSRIISDVRENAAAISYGGGGSSRVHPWYVVSPLEGIVREFPQAEVSYAEGVSTLLKSRCFGGSIFYTPEMRQGLEASYYDLGMPDILIEKDMSPRFVRTDRNVDFEWQASPDDRIESEYFAVRWEGFIVPDRTDSMNMFVDTQGGFRLWVDGILMEDMHGSPSFVSGHYTIPVRKGEKVMVAMEYYGNRSLPAEARFGYCYGSDMDYSEAVKIASEADVVIFCAGFDGLIEKEGKDRPFELTFGQDELVRTLADVNPDLIVAVSAGGGVAMPWIDEVPAVLHMMYPGQEGGTALAGILSGRVNPSGKLPFSIEKAWRDSPVAENYDQTRDERKIYYDEGIFIGYRGYDKSGVCPLFPFGFGLSYTDFTYSDLDLNKDGNGVTVSFTVTNSGTLYGAETAQVYVRDTKSSIECPLKELKGFEKVRLAPGESERVVIRLERESFSHFFEEKGGWAVEPGQFEIWVGSSSSDIRLRDTVYFR